MEVSLVLGAGSEGDATAGPRPGRILLVSDFDGLGAAREAPASPSRGPEAASGDPGAASRGGLHEPLGRLRGCQNILEIVPAQNSDTKIDFLKTYESIAYATVF